MGEKEGGREFFFTFGGGSAFRNHYVVIVINGCDEFEWRECVAAGNFEPVARQVMFNHFGPKWSFGYPIEELEGQAGKYGLTCLCTIHENWPNKPAVTSGLMSTWAE